jgi:hypothetical protein
LAGFDSGEQFAFCSEIIFHSRFIENEKDAISGNRIKCLHSSSHSNYWFRLALNAADYLLSIPGVFSSKCVLAAHHQPDPNENKGIIVPIVHDFGEIGGTLFAFHQEKISLTQNSIRPNLNYFDHS